MQISHHQNEKKAGRKYKLSLSTIEAKFVFNLKHPRITTKCVIRPVIDTGKKIDTGSSKSKISKNASRNNYIIMREDGKRGK